MVGAKSSSISDFLILLFACKHLAFRQTWKIGENREEGGGLSSRLPEKFVPESEFPDC
jgi:hypothetical protein